MLGLALALYLQDVNEPNNTVDEATLARVGDEFQSILQERGDIDYYRFTAPGDGVLALTVIEKPEGHAPYVWWRGDVERDGERDVRVAKGQRVVLGVKSRYYDSDGVASDAPLRLRVDFTAEPFAGEPNDTVETAQPATIGEEIAIALTPRLDVDHLKFTAPGDGVLALTVIEKPEGHAPYVWWRGDVERDGERDVRVAKGQTAVLAIRSRYYNSEETASAEPLRLRVDFTAEPFAGEPNDTVETAQPATIGEEIAIALTPRRDVDHLKFTAPGDGVLALTVIEKPEGHAPYVWWRGDVERDGERDVRVAKGQTAVLAIRSRYYNSEAVASAEPLRLRVDFTAEPFAGEPNDTVETAQPATIGEEIAIALTPRRDIDHLKYTAPGDGVLTLTVIEKPEMHAPYVWWRGDVERDGERDVRVAKGQTVILAVRSRYYPNEEAASTEPIRLRVDFTAEPFAGEPNDTVETAQPATIGEEIAIALTPRRDIDHLKYTAPGDGVLTLTVIEKPEMHAPYVWWRGDVERDGERDVRVAKGQTVILAVRSRYYPNEEAASTEPIRLRVDFTAEPFAGEPNDTIETAQPARVGQEVTIALTPRRDVDHLKYTAPGDGVLTLTVIEKPEMHAPYVWWRGDVERDGARDVRVTEGQTVVLGVRSRYWPNEETASTEPLRLRVDFSPETDASEPANDAREGARDVALGAAVPFRIAPAGEADWWRVTLDRADLVHLIVPDAPVGVRAQLYGDGPDPLDRMQAPAPGVYYVVVTTDGSSLTEMTGYVFAGSPRVARDNTAADRAAPLALGQTVLLSAVAQAQSYYFRLRLERPATIVWTVTWPDGEGTIDADRFAPERPTAMEAGEHLIRVDVRGDGLAAVLFEDDADRLPPELRDLAARSMAEWAGRIEREPPPPPPRVTRSWTFDVEKQDE